MIISEKLVYRNRWTQEKVVQLGYSLYKVLDIDVTTNAIYFYETFIRDEGSRHSNVLNGKFASASINGITQDAHTDGGHCYCICK